MLNIQNRILEVASQTSIPAIWCEIFAKAVQDVSDNLGIEIEAHPGGNGHCIFIAPVLIEESIIDMINFAGFDYQRAWQQQPDHKFAIYTVVGIKRSWFNQQFFPKLQKYPNLIKIIEDIYSPCYFERRIRFNKKLITFHTAIKNYDSLSDYLNDVISSGIYFNHVTPADCINKLQKIFSTLGITPLNDEAKAAIGRLSRYRVKEYNWLEYLQIFTKPTMSCRKFLAQDPATITEFKRQLAQHLIGMILLYLIYREDPSVVEKIKKLIDKSSVI